MHHGEDRCLVVRKVAELLVGGTHRFGKQIARLQRAQAFEEILFRLVARGRACPRREPELRRKPVVAFGQHCARGLREPLGIVLNRGQPCIDGSAQGRILCAARIARDLQELIPGPGFGHAGGDESGAPWSLGQGVGMQQQRAAANCRVRVVLQRREQAQYFVRAALREPDPCEEQRGLRVCGLHAIQVDEVLERKWIVAACCQNAFEQFLLRIKHQQRRRDQQGKAGRCDGRYQSKARTAPRAGPDPGFGCVRGSERRGVLRHCARADTGRSFQA